MRSLLLAALLGLWALSAQGVGAIWLCTPTERLSCNPVSGCANEAPAIGEVRLWPVEGRIEFCIGALCHEGIVSIDREGWPEWKSLGMAIVEALPLKRSYDGNVWFASYEVNDRRFVLSGLSHLGQDITWFDCRQEG